MFNFLKPQESTVITDCNVIDFDEQAKEFRIQMRPEPDDEQEAYQWAAERNLVQTTVPGVRTVRGSVDLFRCTATMMHARIIKDELSSFKTTERYREALRAISKREHDTYTFATVRNGAPIDIPGFDKRPYPFQCDSIRFALAVKKAIIGHEMGLGKTIIALAVIQILYQQGKNPGPVIIVTPPDLKRQWAYKEIPACCPGRSVIIAEKDTGVLALHMADIIVTHYQALVGFESWMSEEDVPLKDPVTKLRQRHSDGALVTERKWVKRSSSKKLNPETHKEEVILSELGEKLLELGPKFVVADEAQALKNGAACHTEAFYKITRSAEYILLLTGTPIMNYPKELASPLKILGMLDNFGGWEYFMQYFCGLARKGKRVDANSALHTKELYELLRRNCFIRYRKDEVQTDLPPLQRTMLEFEIDNRDEYERTLETVIEWAKNSVLNNSEFRAEIGSLSLDVQDRLITEAQDDKVAAAARAEALVQINALKDVASRGMREHIKDWITQFLESGEKLIVFAISRGLTDYLHKEFPRAVTILAGQRDENFANVERFTSDPNCQLLIGALGTSAASSPAGVGHNIQCCSHVLTCELGWNEALHCQAESRSHRNGQTRAVNSYYAIAQNTIYEELWSLITYKSNIANAIQDGGDIAVSKLIKKLIKKRSKRDSKRILPQT